MDYDDRGLAMPKLVGGPKSSRPPAVGVTPAERPPSPDDLPLECERTDEDEALARELGLRVSPVTMTTSSAGGSASATDAGGHAAGHPSGTWTVTGGTAQTSSLSRRGFVSLLRGRNDPSDVG